MGQLLAVIWKQKEDDGVVIDFDNAKPSESEAKIYAQASELLERGALILKTLEDYKGAREEVRKAMGTPNVENEAVAFDALLIVVNEVASFWEYSKRLEEILPRMLDQLSKPVVDEKQPVAGQQALAKQLAAVFDFALRFDQVRMLRPHLPNDFSFYRRLLPKFHKNPNITVKDEDAGAVGLFTADYVPMMNALCRGAAKAAKDNARVADTLALIANSCLKMIKNRKFENTETNMLCARAMTGAVVLFDHVDASGAFHKRSPLHIKPIIQTLIREFPSDAALANALRFTTRTFKSAPDSIQDLFE